MAIDDCPLPEPFRDRAGPVIFLTGIFCLSFVSRAIFAPLLPNVLDDFSLDYGQAGSFFLMISLGVFVAQVGSGIVNSRLNHRRTIIISLLLLTVALLAFAITTAVWQIRLLLFLIGVSAGLYLPSGIASITAMVSKHDWGKALGLHQVAPQVAMLLAPFISVALLGWVRWEVILFGLGIVGVIVAVNFIRAGKFGGFTGQPPNPAVIKTIVKIPSAWMVMILLGIGIGGDLGIYTMLTLYLETERGLPPELAITLLGLCRIAGLFMTFVAGWVTDRIGEKRAIALFLSCAGIAAIVLGSLPSPWVVVLVFVQPALAACFFPAGFSAMSKIVQPTLRSMSVSLVGAGGFLIGAGIVPTFLGFMGDNFSFSTGIIVMGCVMFLGPVLAFRLKFVEHEEEGC